MRFLITGVAGFIGSAVAKRLLEDGHEVRGLDDLSTGSEDRLPPELLFDRGDINDMPKLWSLLADVDTVIHAAARVSVGESDKFMRDYNHVNVGGTVTLLEAMRDREVKRIIFTSSGAIYGDQPQQPISETAEPNPLSPYAVSKLASEYYIRSARGWGMETLALRIFNAYGVGQQLPISNPPVIPAFFKQIASGGSVTLHGKGEQTRDFVYVEDVAAIIARAATMPELPDTTVLNVGSGVGTSIRHVAEMIGKLVKRSPKFVMPYPNSGGVENMQADLTQLKRVLEVSPQITLAAGLQRIWEDDGRFHL